MGNSCNTTSHPIVVSIFTTTVTDPATNVASPFLGNVTTACTVKSGGHVFTLCSGTHMNEIKQEHAVNIYPNPVSSVLSIEIQKPNFRLLRFGIKNILSQPLLSEQENNSSTFTNTIDLRFLSKGIYFLEVNVDGVRTVKKVVKK